MASGHDSTGDRPLVPGKHLGPGPWKEHCKGCQEATGLSLCPLALTPSPLPKMLQMVLSSSRGLGVPLCPIYRPGPAGDVLAYQPRARGDTETQQELAPLTIPRSAPRVHRRHSPGQVPDSWAPCRSQRLWRLSVAEGPAHCCRSGAHRATARTASSLNTCPSRRASATEEPDPCPVTPGHCPACCLQKLMPAPNTIDVLRLLASLAGPGARLGPSP